MKKTKILLIAAVVSCMMFSAVACGSRDNEADDNYVTSGGERNTTTNRNNETTTNRNNETTSSKIVGGAGADAADTARDVGRDALDTVEEDRKSVV